MKLKKNDLVKLYSNLVRARKFDQASIRMIEQRRAAGLSERLAPLLSDPACRRSVPA